MPDARRNQRATTFFGHHGRTSLRSSGVWRGGVKLEHMGEDYDPLDDTCVKAFVRMIALMATAAVAEAAA